MFLAKATIAALLCTAIASTVSANPLQLSLDTGKVLGTWADVDRDIRVFKGLPFAAPPTGERRFAPPADPSSWSGVRKATQFGAACPQHEARDAFVWSRGDFTASEDCLYLNVWAPSQAEGDLPVMVWFHGGAHTTGYAHAKIFDGTELAARGVVLVTVNYRLGALGFLAHPALSQVSEHNASGNYGLMDKMAALRWVQRNISQFGGSPENVTIFGQSAGSQSVCALITAPAARGLFHKAIGQSAGCALPSTESDPDGIERGVKLATEALGDVPTTAAALRALSVQQILDAELATNWAARSRITVDGWVLPTHPSVAYQNGTQANVALMVGSAGNEGEGLLPLAENLSAEAYQARVEKLYGERAQQVLKAYASISPPAHALREIMSDQFFAYAMRAWAQAQAQIDQPSYLYFMEHVPPAFKLYDPDEPELALPGGPRSAGAYHSGDLAFVFANTGKIGVHWNEADHRVAKAMADAWVRFATTGNPNGPGVPNWPGFQPDAHAVMVFADPPRVEVDVRPERKPALGP